MDGGIRIGLRSVAGGIGFVVSTPSVWLWALTPVVMLLLLSVGLGWSAYLAADETARSLSGGPEGLWAQVGSWLLYVALVGAAVLTALILAFALAQPLSGFALERIALAQERALGHEVTGVSFVTSTLASLKVALVTLPVAVVVLGSLFLTGLLIPPAAVFTVPLQFLVAGWLLAWNFVDYPLSLRGLGLRARLRWVRDHGAAFTAFGLTWALLLPVPGVYFLALPMGVAGAARLVLACEGPGLRRGYLPGAGGRAGM